MMASKGSRFGLRRFIAAFFPYVVSTLLEKKSGDESPHSKRKELP
jgi:hypothetical protein